MLLEMLAKETAESMSAGCILEEAFCVEVANCFDHINRV